MELTTARIGVVDDNRELCQMVRQICARKGFSRADSHL